jgi:hypothetical protein
MATVPILWSVLERFWRKFGEKNAVLWVNPEPSMLASIPLPSTATSSTSSDPKESRIEPK